MVDTPFTSSGDASVNDRPRSHALQDYQMQMMLLDQQSKRRALLRTKAHVAVGAGSFAGRASSGGIRSALGVSAATNKPESARQNVPQRAKLQQRIEAPSHRPSMNVAETEKKSSEVESEESELSDSDSMSLFPSEDAPSISMPYKCNSEGCLYSARGFSTASEATRHMANAVHVYGDPDSDATTAGAGLGATRASSQTPILPSKPRLPPDRTELAHSGEHRGDESSHSQWQRKINIMPSPPHPAVESRPNRWKTLRREDNVLDQDAESLEGVYATPDGYIIDPDVSKHKKTGTVGREIRYVATPAGYIVKPSVSTHKKNGTVARSCKSTIALGSSISRSVLGTRKRKIHSTISRDNTVGQGTIEASRLQNVLSGRRDMRHALRKDRDVFTSAPKTELTEAEQDRWLRDLQDPSAKYARAEPRWPLDATSTTNAKVSRAKQAAAMASMRIVAHDGAQGIRSRQDSSIFESFLRPDVLTAESDVTDCRMLPSDYRLRRLRKAVRGYTKALAVNKEIGTSQHR